MIVEKDAAAAMKKSLEAQFGGLWHVVLGVAFGASVTHESAALTLFKIGKVNVLAFQTFDDASLVMKKEAGSRPAYRTAESKKEDDEEEA